MSTRHYCDICDDEVESVELRRKFDTFLTVLGNGSAVGIEISRSVDGAWNGGHICNECLANALTKVQHQLYDERDRVEEDRA